MSGIKTTQYCPKCNKTVSFIAQREEDVWCYKGSRYPYMRMTARCVCCNEELDVNGDENIKAAYDAYRVAHNIISLEKIREIPAMYHIGKRVLSNLLGWGEQTFTRYYDGYLPSKQYSEVLKRLYDNPSYYREVLEEGRHIVNEASYRKSKLAIQKLLSLNTTPIVNVTGYLCRVKDDLSSFRLQKLLYYIQGVSAAFQTLPLFSDPCEAWVNGPVFRDIYIKYKDNAIDDIFGDLLTTGDREVIDCVLRCFGRYDGDTLKEFTHRELPWLKARGDLAADAPSSKVIPLEDIKEYFTSVKDRYGMSEILDMGAYAQDMFASLQTIE